MTERARETLHEARDVARGSLTQATETAVSVGERTSDVQRKPLALEANRNVSQLLPGRPRRA